MDQQAASYEPQASGTCGAHPPHETPGPLGPLALALSLFGIAGSAVLLCCVIAVVALLILVVNVGTEGVSELYDELKFDPPLETRIGAGIVSALYVGLAGATVAAAILRGGRRWTGLVALSRVRRGRGAIAGIFLVSLAYAALATYAMERTQDRHLLISGPTDMLLIGTILANLVLLAPIAEELLFRGWIYTALRRRFGVWLSFVATALFFVAIHWNPNNRRILQVLPLALALGLLRERAGSIKPTIALHAVYNLIIVLMRLAYT